jgi:hypothetical protein
MPSPSFAAWSRRLLEGQQTSLCRVGVATVITDPTTLQPVTTFEQVVYTGPCKIRSESTRTTSVDVGGQDVAVQLVVLSLPIVGSEDVRTGHTVVIDGSTYDPALAAHTYRISGAGGQSFETARRFPVEVVS